MCWNKTIPNNIYLIISALISLIYVELNTFNNFTMLTDINYEVY